MQELYFLFKIIQDFLLKNANKVFLLLVFSLQNNKY